MIEHLRGREESFRTLWMDRAGSGMDRPGLSPQRRFHPRSILSLLRCKSGSGRFAFVKALVERRAAVEGEWPVSQRGRREVMPDIEQADLPGAWS